MKHLLCILSLLAAPAMAGARPEPKVELRVSERIALVGNEFFERDQDQAYIETQLTTRFPEKNLTFRNLGYSGDTVWADARSLCAGWANFGPADQGFGRLTKLVSEIKPTLVLLAYGMNESFDGPKGLAHFEQGLNRMLDMLAATGARIVVISPIPHENLGPPLPDPAQHNQNIRLYSDSMRKIAQQRQYAFIDLYEELGGGTQAAPTGALTSDGIHLTSFGYWRVAGALERAMGHAPRQWDVELDAGTGKSKPTGARLEEVHTSANEVSFRAIDDVLPLAPLPRMPLADRAMRGQTRTLRIKGLAGGMYVLKSDDRPIATATAGQWSHGVPLSSGPEQDQEEELRKLIITKNFDFFNYWRPENDTYIFGYRKHEQGRNAVEIPKFEALVPASEARIATLRVPVAHRYVLTRADGK